MTDRELLQQALAELAHCRVFVTTREKIKHPEGTELYDKVLEALRARLAQPEPEPVAWVNLNALTEQINSVNCGTVYRLPSEAEGRQPLYTAPPQRVPAGVNAYQEGYEAGYQEAMRRMGG